MEVLYLLKRPASLPAGVGGDVGAGPAPAHGRFSGNAGILQIWSRKKWNPPGRRGEGTAVRQDSATYWYPQVVPEILDRLAAAGRHLKAQIYGGLTRMRNPILRQSACAWVGPTLALLFGFCMSEAAVAQPPESADLVPASPGTVFRAGELSAVFSKSKPEPTIRRKWSAAP